MGSIGWWEIIIIILIVVLIFGARKIPELGKSLGEGIRNFRKSVKGETEEKPTTDQSEEKKAGKQ